MVEVLHFEDGNDLIVYPKENGVHPFEWSNPPKDAPWTSPGPNEEPPPPTNEQLEEDYDWYKYRQDRPF